MTGCESSPSSQLIVAIGEFNRGDWFRCHESLEELWLGEQGEMRDFYQGILQIAVALHHWRNGNYRGSISLLDGGTEYLQRVSDVCHRIDVAGFVAASRAMRQALSDLGPERMSQLPHHLIPRLHLVPS